MESVFANLGWIIFGLVGLLFLFSCWTTVDQGSMGVITQFGKFKRIIAPGLNFKIPLLESISKKISIQNQSSELKFEAITKDQAKVTFKSMLTYKVKDSLEETIKDVAFKFASGADLAVAMRNTIEGIIRGFIATKEQKNLLELRTEIVHYLKEHFDPVFTDWGYMLLDFQINDIAFDQKIMASMADIVASANLKQAAENEGQALLIQMTKKAEAEGNAIKIQAQAEKEAAKLRGEGVAEFRKAVAEGLAASAKEVENSGLDANVIVTSMWIEGFKEIAERGEGNVIFFDGSQDNMKRMTATNMLNNKALNTKS